MDRLGDRDLWGGDGAVAAVALQRMLGVVLLVKLNCGGLPDVAHDVLDHADEGDGTSKSLRPRQHHEQRREIHLLHLQQHPRRFR